jgi:hypothetical protein
MAIDWKQRPAVTTEIDLFTYVRTDEAFWEAGKRAAVNLLRGVVPEHGIAEICNGRSFNPSATDFKEEVTRLATLWLLANPQPPAADRPPKPAAAADDSAWVLSSPSIWQIRLENNKALTEFRKQHGDMFRNPSRNRLEIHAAKWAAFWTARDKAGFETLDGNLQSVADDPAVQEETLAGIMQRAAAIRAKKKAGKQ